MIIAKIVFPFDSEMFLFFLQPFSLFDVVRVIAHTNLLYLISMTTTMKNRLFWIKFKSFFTLSLLYYTWKHWKAIKFYDLLEFLKEKF